MTNWSEQRKRLIDRAIKVFGEGLLAAVSDERWRHYSDLSLKRYDLFKTVATEAEVLREAYRQSQAKAAEARAYLEPVIVALRQSATEYTNPAQFGTELLIFDREVEAALNLAKKPDQVVSAFKEGTKFTTNNAQRYAWIRNLDKAILRVEDLAGKRAQGDAREAALAALRIVLPLRARLEHLRDEAFAKTFPDHAEFMATIAEREAELRLNSVETYGGDRRALTNAFRVVAAAVTDGTDDNGRPQAIALLEEFAKGFERWLDEPTGASA